MTLHRERACPRTVLRRAGTFEGGLAPHGSWRVLAQLGLLMAVAPGVALAQSAAVPLPAGTLPVLRGVVSGQVVVNAPVKVASRPQLTIDQTSLRGIVDWKSFDIAADGEVRFNQPSSTASTLNRIYGANPSVIQGKLTANGQVLLINQNGVLFERGSQVHVGSLVTSTLNLTNERFLSGVLTSATDAAFQGGYDDTGKTLPTRPDGSRTGAVRIGGGRADSAAPTIEAAPGGSVMVFAPNIENDGGVVKSPDGQVILGAGRKAFLTANPDSGDITLRGLVVEVQAEEGGAGLNLSNLIRNNGQISADRGNVSLAALAINQQGRISADTAVQSNGSIFLKARAQTESAGIKAGRVTLAAGSVTAVDPSVDDKATLVEGQDYAAFRGVVDVRGGVIDQKGTLRATGGRLLLKAENAAEPDAARVYLDQGSVTSAAGAWSDVDFAKNLATFRVTSNELKNAPDQKDGILRGATVTVDLRRDNAILALDGYRNTVARTVAEKASVGGELTIESSGSVVQRSGATLDVSGGGYRYAEGLANTTRLLGEDGKVYDIASAPQAMRYTAQLDRVDVNSDRWGQALNFANPLGTVGTYQPAYVEGKAAGVLNIGSRAGIVLDGTLQGGVTIGAQQTARAPAEATLRIGSGIVASTGAYNVDQTIGNVAWRAKAADSLGNGFQADTALTQVQRETLQLAANQVFGAASQGAQGRVEQGFGNVELNSNGRISVPAGVHIESDIGAQLLLRGTAVDVAGDIRLPAGKLTLATIASPGSTIGSDPVPAADRLTVRNGAELSTAGAWLNHSARDGAAIGTALPSGRVLTGGSVKRAIDGGDISLSLDDASFETRLDLGAILDVGGGASINASQRVTGGQGGKLAIATGSVGQSTSDWLRADLRGAAPGIGGELTLSAGRLLIQPDGAEGVLPSTTTRLSTALFSEQGFSKVTVNGVGDVAVTPGTTLTVQQKTLVIDPALAVALPTGGSLAAVAALQLLPDQQRAAASVALSGETVAIGSGASITTDPRGQIALGGISGLRVDGSLTAPGGSITLGLRGPDTLTATDLQIGANSTISARGSFTATPDARGLTIGTLVNGGSVTVSAAQAGVHIERGAVIDVSGVSKLVDGVDTGSNPGLLPQTVTGHAGTLTIRTQGSTVLDGRLLGHGGDAAAAGGSFVLESRQPDQQATVPAERRIVVAAGAAAAPQPAGHIDATVRVDALHDGGFEKLRLLSENRISFQGSSSLRFDRGIRLDAPLIELLGNSSVDLQGAHIALGQSLAPRVQETNSAGVNVWQSRQPVASPLLATRAGEGQLRIDGAAVDFFGSLTLNGTQRTVVDSDSDVRFIGRETTAAAAGQPPEQVGRLHTAGNLEFKAAQLYPATRTSFEVVVADQPTGALRGGSYLQVAGNGSKPGDVYSAGGALTLKADTLVQAGVVKAPQGSLVLQAGRTLDLAAGSVSSVSGEGLTVLYGTTQSGVTWNYADGGSNNVAEVSAVSATGKRVALSAADVQVREGAKVDLGGGGSVLAVEFVPGNGGDKDVTLQDNTYAIVPKSRLASMPYDSHLQLALDSKDIGFGFSVTQGRDNVLYDAIDIGAGSAVPAGTYVLLPARFAHVPEAYLVQLQTGNAYRNLQTGQVLVHGNRDVVVPGHRVAAGTAVRESQSVGVVVLPGSSVARSSDYTLSGAQLLAQNAERAREVAPLSPWDAGRLTISDARTLALQGEFVTGAAASPVATPARAAQIDIQAPRIAVVDTLGRTDLPADMLQVSGNSLTRLDASVLLGGQRSVSAEGVRIATAADEVRIANTAAGEVVLPELIVVAKDRIDVAEGSALRATGVAAGTTAGTIQAEASGAMLRLSTGAQVQVDRGAASAASGDVRIAAGATLAADGSLLVDATRRTESSGRLLVGGRDGGGALSLSAASIGLGTSGANADRLVLSQQDLLSYATLDALLLRGYQSIDLAAGAVLGSPQLDLLKLDTPLLRAADGASDARTRIVARELTFSNGSTLSASTSGGAAELAVQAERVTLGAGSKAIAGFGSVSLEGRNQVLLDGTGALRVGAALTITSPMIQAAGGARQSVVAVDDSPTSGSAYRPLRLDSGTGGVAPASAPLSFGGQVAFTGSRVEIATSVQASSGSIRAQAMGTQAGDGVALAAGATLDAAGRTRSFNGSVVSAAGGQVLLDAAASVAVKEGARVDVSAAAAGGDAGRLTVRTSALTVEGELAGRSDATGRSGAIELDLGQLGNFSVLNDALNRGGFQDERSLRLRSGDLAVAAGDDVAARRVLLTADAGRIDVAGRLGSGAAAGGAQVELHAATGLALAAGSRIRANASSPGARGGDVRVSTRGGTLGFDLESEIDVRAGDAGPAGSVSFGVTRDAAHQTGLATLNGTVRRTTASDDSVASVDLEATRIYDGVAVGSNLTATRINALAADHAAFVADVTPRSDTLTAGLRDETGQAIKARVLGATELRAAGNLTLDSTWDLGTASWLAGQQPGTLTLRAAGDLTLKDTLGAPRLATNTASATTNNSNQNLNHALHAGETWNIRLVGGADLGASDTLATVARTSLPAGQGGVLLNGANAGVRTGTGRIDIAAAGDVRIDHVAASIYTAGRAGAPDAEANATNGSNRWGIDGGSISIRAGGDIAGPAEAKDLWITEWLRRPRLAPNAFDIRANPTDWWTYRPRFQQAVGTLAGGDIDLRAEGSLLEFSAMLPTNGRTYLDADKQRQVEVTGGGNLKLSAGGDIVGGTYLIGRGSGRIVAGGDIGLRERTQLYLMGVSSGAVPESAQIDLVAGGGVALRSANNPTMLSMINSNGAAGPSFDASIPSNTNNLAPTRFFTYSGNSAVGVQAKSGDVHVEGVIAEATTYNALWRGYLPTAPVQSATALGANTAFPASLSLVALDGDVIGPQGQGRIKTYPSRDATVSVLAGRSVSDLSIEVSDLDPAALVTTSSRVRDARPVGSEGTVSSGTLISTLEPRNLSAGRITERDTALPFGLVARDGSLPAYRFEVQALVGSVSTKADGASSLLVLPALSRVRAGTDISDVEFKLQNLATDDVSEIRADTGDLRYSPSGGFRRLSMGGPGRLLIQAGRNIDLGTVPIQSLGNDLNPALGDTSARLTLVAGVSGDVDLQRLGGGAAGGGADGAYGDIVALNLASKDILDLYSLLSAEPDTKAVLEASTIAALTTRDPAYARFTRLDTIAPRALAAYQALLRSQDLPLGSGADVKTAEALYQALNAEPDLRRLQAAGSIAALAAAPGGAALQPFVELDARYPRLFSDYLTRRSEGARPTSVTPIVFSDALSGVVAGVAPTASAAGGSILSYQSSIQTFGGSDIDLWAPAPGGNIVAGLTTPSGTATVGVLTLAGGAIRSVLGGDFNVNQGKVITARGGDILMLTLGGSIDAGRGAKTSLTTAPPQVVREPDGRTSIVFSTAATGSGIQSLSSDPDGLGPLSAPRPGDVYLFAPAGSINAGEAGIRSSGNILINAQTVLNASDIRAGGSSQGVPVAASGSLASSLATSGSTSAGSSKAGEDTANAGASAARAASAAAQMPKPTILVVEVLGFGDKNCKEQDKNCFAK